MINYDYFKIIEEAGDDGITASQLALKASMDDVQLARNWLSKWKSRGYLKRIAYSGTGSGVADDKFSTPKRGRPTGTESRYILGEKHWSALTHAVRDDDEDDTENY